MLIDIAKFKKLNLSSFSFFEPLKKHTTMYVGGYAAVFVNINKIKELKKVIKFSKKYNIRLVVLGNGSNTIFKDGLLNAIVISLNLKKVSIKKHKKYAIITAGGGAKTMSLLHHCEQLGLSGLEWSAGIPASVGGAIYMNMASFNSSMAKITRSVKVLDYSKKRLKIRNLRANKCEFSYKHSIFMKNNLIILSAKLKFDVSSPKLVKAAIKQNYDKKKKTQPLGTRNAGCVYKNEKNIAVAKCIDEAGLKGKTIGGAQISPIHASFITNNCNASCQNVKDLIKYTQEIIFARFGFIPKLEIIIVE